MCPLSSCTPLQLELQSSYFKQHKTYYYHTPCTKFYWYRLQDSGDIKENPILFTIFQHPVSLKRSRFGPTFIKQKPYYLMRSICRRIFLHKIWVVLYNQWLPLHFWHVSCVSFYAKFQIVNVSVDIKVN